MCECVWGCIYVIIPVCGLNSSTKLIKANKSRHDAMCQTHVPFIVHFPLRAFVSDVYNCILLLVIVSYLSLHSNQLGLTWTLPNEIQSLHVCLCLIATCRYAKNLSHPDSRIVRVHSLTNSWKLWRHLKWKYTKTVRIRTSTNQLNVYLFYYRQIQTRRARISNGQLKIRGLNIF